MFRNVLAIRNIPLYRSHYNIATSLPHTTAVCESISCDENADSGVCLLCIAHRLTMYKLRVGRPDHKVLIVPRMYTIIYMLLKHAMWHRTTLNIHYTVAVWAVPHSVAACRTLQCTCGYDDSPGICVLCRLETPKQQRQQRWQDVIMVMPEIWILVGTDVD